MTDNLATYLSKGTSTPTLDQLKGHGNGVKKQGHNMHIVSQPLSLDNLDQHIKQLPSLSEIIMEVLDLFEKEDIDFQNLMKKISQDQNLAAQILKVANSPFYGFPQDIGSLKDAGVMLGVHTLKDIVTSVGIIGHFSSKLKNGFNHTLFWQHAIGTGITARVLARSCDIDQDVAFTAGLLHDIGKLVLDVHFPDEFACVLARRDSDNCLLREAETLVLGFDHTVVGAKVAQQWKLPAAIQEVILYHHDYEQLRSKPLVNLIHISDIVCRGLEIGNGGDSLIPALEPEALDRLGLDWNILQAYLPQIEEMNASANLLFEPNEKNVSVC